MVTEGDRAGVARRRAHMPEGSAAILDARSLATAHRRLASLLRPGLSVLDVGCGTGAITRGIAEAVGREGRAVGVDVDPAMIDKARAGHAGVSNLSFAVADACALPFRGIFDVVTAARVLQWLADPEAAVRWMTTAVKRSGRVVILDFNHEKVSWTPEPPASMRRFYSAFLRWRDTAGMDNAIADHLAELFAKAGLAEITTTEQHEMTRRADPDFEIGRASCR